MLISPFPTLTLFLSFFNFNPFQELFASKDNDMAYYATLQPATNFIYKLLFIRISLIVVFMDIEKEIRYKPIPSPEFDAMYGWDVCGFCEGRYQWRKHFDGKRTKWDSGTKTHKNICHKCSGRV